jgi:hypothetical protein
MEEFIVIVILGCGEAQAPGPGRTSEDAGSLGLAYGKPGLTGRGSIAASLSRR